MRQTLTYIFLSLCFLCFAGNTKDVYNVVYDSLFLEGLCYKNIDSLDIALSRFKECEKIDDTNPALYYEMSKIYESKEEFTALFCLDKAYQLDPKNYYYAVSLAELYDKNGNYESSIEIYKDLSKQYPENKNVLFFLYRAYLLNNQIDKSIQTLEKLEDMVGTNKLISFEKVRLYASQKKYKKAINTLNDLIEKYPIDTELYVMRGEMIMEQEGDVEEMLENFNQALAIDPNSPAVQEALCRYYSSIYDKERTEYYLFKILANENISESDKYKYIEYALNNSQFSANQAEYIENIFQTVIKANPESTKILLTYARTLNGLKDYEKMYDVLYSSVLVDEKCKECWQELMRCYFKLPPETLSTDKIREIMNQALKEFPEDSYLNFVDAILMVAEDANVDENILFQKFKKALEFSAEDKFLKEQICYFMSMLHLPEAILYIRDYIHLFPNNLMMQNNYAYQLARLVEERYPGSTDEEKKELKTYIEEAEKISSATVIADAINPYYLDTYAYILFLQKKYNLAKFYIEQALNYDKEGSYEILEHSGDIMEALGDKEAALGYWKAAYFIKQTENLLNKIKKYEK